MGFSVWGCVQRWIQVETRPSAVSLRPRLSVMMSTTPTTAHPTSFISSLKRTRPISIITQEARKTSTADEVCAGKITRHDTRTGIRMGQVPSRQIFRWRAEECQVQNFQVGTIRIRSIFDWRPASCRARKSTVATFKASEGWNWKGPSGIQRAAPLVVAPIK